MRHCYRGHGVFRLREILRESPPVVQDPEMLVYSASELPPIDVGQLVYFCSSVFWRASVTGWSLFGEKFDPINLGKKYQEELRRYLLGKNDFPDTATVSIFVSQLNKPLLTFSFPESFRSNSRHTHQMHIPGITFVLTMGKALYSTWLTNCVFRSPHHPPASAASARFRDASVRMRSFSFQAPGRPMRDEDGMWVARLHTTSFPATARRSASGSNNSARTGRAPSSPSSAARASVRADALDVVALGDEEGHRPPPQDAGGAGDEHLHVRPPPELRTARW